MEPWVWCTIPGLWSPGRSEVPDLWSPGRSEVPDLWSPGRSEVPGLWSPGQSEVPDLRSPGSGVSSLPSLGPQALAEVIRNPVLRRRVVEVAPPAYKTLF